MFCRDPVLVPFAVVTAQPGNTHGHQGTELDPIRMIVVDTDKGSSVRKTDLDIQSGGMQSLGRVPAGSLSGAGTGRSRAEGALPYDRRI